MRKVGEVIRIEVTGYILPYIECIVVALHPEDGRVIKIKAVMPDENLIFFGFMEEDGDYVCIEWDICLN